MLGIPFYIWDLSDRFAADVVADFVAEYAAGRTPNPCLRCNEKIKFAAVLDRALALGFDAVCTGHYARLVRTGPTVELHRAVDEDKDQSYVLGVLTQAQLQHSIFPLGTSVKSDVRAEAQRRGLAVAEKPDSHDICFIADGDTAGFLTRQLGRRDGDIVDRAGHKVGEHSGTHQFTVGQRRGLHLGVPAVDGQPRYVLDISPVSNTVTVGPRDALAVRSIRADPADLDPGPHRRALVGRRAAARPRGAAGRDGPRSTTTSRWCWTPRPAGSLRARPWCSTTAPAWSAAPPSPRRPRELRLRRSASPASGPGPAPTWPTRSRSPSPSARICPTSPSFPPGARTRR